jgi:hypothetical protein
MTIIGELFGIRPDAWELDAVCSSVDPEAFYPPPGTSTLPARLVCASCPVRAICLETALARNETEGVWGGYSPRQRRRLKRGETVELATRPEPGEGLVCAQCGAGFIASHGTAKYCSKYCSKNAQTERNQQKRRALREAA